MPTTFTTESYGPDRTNPGQARMDSNSEKALPGERTLSQATVVRGEKSRLRGSCSSLRRKTETGPETSQSTTSISPITSQSHTATGAGSRLDERQCKDRRSPASTQPRFTNAAHSITASYCSGAASGEVAHVLQVESEHVASARNDLSRHHAVLGRRHDRYLRESMFRVRGHRPKAGVVALSRRGAPAARRRADA